jgi:hypothetical protein
MSSLATRKGGAFSTDRVEALLALLKARSSGSSIAGVGSSFLFKPGGTPGGNVFTTWPTLIAALAKQPAHKWIVVDNSIAPAIVPAGGPYNLDECTFLGGPSTPAGQPELIFAAGATITANVLRIAQSLGFQNSGSVVWTIAASAPPIFPFLYLEENGFLLASPGAPFVHVTAGATFLCECFGGSMGDTTNAVIQVDAGATLDLNAIATGGMTSNAIAGAGTFAMGLGVGGFFEQPQGLEPTITYIDPPATIGEANAVAITAAPLVFTSTGTITRKTSGLVRGSACASVTGAAPGAPVTFDVLRNPGGVLVATQTVDGGATFTQCTVPVFDTLPDQVAHTYAIRVTNAAAPLTAAAGQARISLTEET